MSGEYEVGYGKPPKHSRFRKGQSGNRKGRPKGAKNLRTQLKEILNRPVVFQKNGKPQRLTLLQAMTLAQANRAMMKSDPKAFTSVMTVAAKAGLLELPPDPAAKGGVLVVPADVSPEEWVRQQQERDQKSEAARANDDETA